MSGFVIRPAKEDDAFAMIEAHGAAIREKAAAHYPQNVIDSWVWKHANIERLKEGLKNPDTFTIVAEAEGKIIGLGMATPKNNELGAVYVRKNPFKCVGKAIVQQLIDHAKKCGATFLAMKASVNAESFYNKVGFKTVEHTIHKMNSGVEMNCVKMRIDFQEEAAHE